MHAPSSTAEYPVRGGHSLGSAWSYIVAAAGVEAHRSAWRRRHPFVEDFVAAWVKVMNDDRFDLL
jgi:catalase (peroxidase I)